MRLSIVTPTRDRPEAFALCERWIARQTRPPEEWIVVDDGDTPARPTLGQVHARLEPGKSGAQSFADNVRKGLEIASGDLIAVIEDDDFYPRGHLEDLVARLARADLAGSVWQPYYNLKRRVWKLYHNRGASLCQTGLRRSLLSLFFLVIDEAKTENSFGIDGKLWAAAKRVGLALDNHDALASIGIKGLPGLEGLGVGHRPTNDWTPDPDGAKLREWVGDDAGAYEPFLGSLEREAVVA